VATGAGARAADRSVKDRQGEVGWPDTVSACTHACPAPRHLRHTAPAHGSGVGLDATVPQSRDMEQQNVDT